MFYILCCHHCHHQHHYQQQQHQQQQGIFHFLFCSVFMHISLSIFSLVNLHFFCQASANLETYVL